MISCHEIDDRMVDWLYGELDQHESSAIDAHLAQCQSCAAQAASLKRAREAFHALPEEEPPAALTAMLLHEAATARPLARKPAEAVTAPSMWERFFRFFQPIAAHPGLAATASLVVVVAVAGALYLRKGVSMLESDASRPPAEKTRGEKEAAPRQIADQSTPAIEKADSDRQPAPAAKSPPASPTQNEAIAEPIGEQAEQSQMRGADSVGVVGGVADGRAHSTERKPKEYPADLLDARRESELKKEIKAKLPAKNKKQDRVSAGKNEVGLGSEQPPPPPAPAPSRAAGPQEGAPSLREGETNATEQRQAFRQKDKDSTRGAAPAGHAAARREEADGNWAKSPAPAEATNREGGGAPQPRSIDKKPADEKAAKKALATEPDADDKASLAFDDTEADAAATPSKQKPAAGTAAEQRKRSEEQFKQIAKAVYRKRCAEAIGIAKEVRARDPEYYRNEVQSNPGLRKCRAAERARAARRARAKKEKGGAKSPPPAKAAPADEKLESETKEAQ
jgi:hypothetical protein